MCIVSRISGTALRASVTASAGLLILLLLAIGGCERNNSADPSLLRVSAVPCQAPATVRAQNQRLVDHVCKSVGLDCQWVITSSYLDFVERFGQGEIDLALFGGVTFILAHERYGAAPLVMRDIDARFTSGIYVRSGESARTLQELRGRSFAFGSQHSTSGYYMPRHYLREAGIDAVSFFDPVIYTKGHDDTLARIERGEVDAGAANSRVARKLMKTQEPKLRLLWETPPYTNYVWAVRTGLSDGLRLRLRDAFLALRLAEPGERMILEEQGARGYLPASTRDFAALDEIMKNLDGQGHRK